MKDRIPLILILVIAVSWSEYRYQKLRAHLESLEYNRVEKQVVAPQKSLSVDDPTTFQRESARQRMQVTEPSIQNQKSSGIVKDTHASPKSSASLDLDNPDVQEELHQFLEDREKEQKEIQRAEGLGKYLDYIDRKIETFSQDHELTATVSQALMTEIQTRTNEYVAVEHAAEDGEIEWSEAKPEMERIKEEGKVNLTEILGGEEEYQEFERFVWGRK